VKTFVLRVVTEEDPFEDGRMAYAAHVRELKSFGAASWGYTREEALGFRQRLACAELGA